MSKFSEWQKHLEAAAAAQPKPFKLEKGNHRLEVSPRGVGANLCVVEDTGKYQNKIMSAEELLRLADWIYENFSETGTCCKCVARISDPFPWCKCQECEEARGRR